MDSDKTNSKVRDFDLNITYEEEEDVDLNAQKEFPLPIITDTHQPSQDGTNEEVMMMEDANKVDNNEVQQSLEVDTHVQSNSAASEDSREVDPDYIPDVSFASVKITKRRRSSRGFAPNASKGDNEVHQSSKVDTTIEANSGASEDVKHKEPKDIASSSAPVRISQQRPSRHQHHRGGEVQKSTTNSELFCTNFVCKTKETPMWRRGPLGPRTLCNACGLQYVKIVRGKGSVKGGAVPDGDEDYDEDGDDAFTDAVPAETAEGDSNI